MDYTPGLIASAMARTPCRADTVASCGVCGKPFQRFGKRNDAPILQPGSVYLGLVETQEVLQ